jgi:type I restriction-modification system DNA methylase subunit
MDENNCGSYRDLLKGFESNPVFAHMHPYDLYRQWLEAVWALLNLPLDVQAFKTTLDAYTFAQGQELGRLFNLYLQAVEELPFRDILGTIFMKLDVNSVRAGQYFTPWPIAEMMARMTFDRGEFLRLVKERGEVSVCDPACGSGVMLLAFGKVVHDAFGRDGTARLRLYGMDIDPRCVAMCRIQLRMNGLDGFGRMAALLQGHEQPAQAQAELFTEFERVPA